MNKYIEVSTPNYQAIKKVLLVDYTSIIGEEEKDHNQMDRDINELRRMINRDLP